MTLERFDGAQLSRAVFDETNRVREEHHVPPLGPNPVLDSAADEQAAHMALVTHTEHSNPFPGEHTVADRVEHLGLLGVRVAENAIMEPALRSVGSPDRIYTYSQYAAFLVEAWMNSPGHRVNILNPGFTYLGCAARLGHGAVASDQRVYAIQVFFLPDKDQGEEGLRSQ